MTKDRFLNHTINTNGQKIYDNIKGRIIVAQSSQFFDEEMLQTKLNLGSRMTHISPEEVQDFYDIRISPSYVLIFIGSGLITAAVATLIALALSLRLSP